MPRPEMWAALFSALGMAASGAEAARAVGDWVEIRLAGQTLQAEVRVAEAPHTLAVRIPDLNQASLFVELEPGGDQPSCGFWLSTYDLTPEKKEELEAGLAELCAGLIED